MPNKRYNQYLLEDYEKIQERRTFLKTLINYTLAIGIGAGTGWVLYPKVENIMKKFAVSKSEAIKENEVLMLMRFIVGYDDFQYKKNPRGWMPYVEQDVKENIGLKKMISSNITTESSINNLYSHINETRIPFDKKIYQKPLWHPGLKQNHKNQFEQELKSPKREYDPFNWNNPRIIKI